MIALAGCESGPSGPDSRVTTTTLPPATTSSVPPTTPPTTLRAINPTQAPSDSTAPAFDEGDITGFERRTVTIAGEPLELAIAATPTERSRGLMHVEDFGDFDGMLFWWDADTSGGFWMKNTLVPLDIAFFDAEGALVTSFRMEPCVTDRCTVYRTGQTYRYAVERPAGAFDGLPDGARLDLTSVDLP